MLQKNNQKIQVEIPEKFHYLFEYHRYKIAYGGRGSAKSWQYARVLLILACSKTLRIVCAREFQNSISLSVYQLLCDQIEILGLSGLFNITLTSITCNTTGSSFRFVGLRNNITSIKSLEGANIVWVEEAETISEISWAMLLPTVSRTVGAEVWISFNPNQEDDPTYKRFVLHPPQGAYVVKVTWRDNPWFIQEMVDLMNHDRELDEDLYQWVWEGECRVVSDAVIFNKKCHVEEFTPLKTWDGPYYGIDWGFSSDPTVMVRCWVYNGDLYIEREVLIKGTITENLPKLLLEGDPHCNKYTIRADCARPETIAGVKVHNFPHIVPCKKWSGCVEDGISYIKMNFKRVVIHPSCVNTIKEARLYKYKVDRLSGDISADIVDAYNHSWDAIRYSLQPMITQFKPGQIQYI